MTELPPPSPPSPPLHEAVETPLMRGVRWFAAEFLVVVAGILVALALQAWFEDRQEANREQVLLAQLGDELLRTERSLELSMEHMEGSLATSSRLLIAYTNPAAADEDSVAAWIARVGWYNVPDVNLGLARGLASGGYATLDDDSVRVAVFALVESADSYRLHTRENLAGFLSYSNQLRAKAPFTGRLANLLAGADSATFVEYYSIRPFEPAGRVAFPTDMAALLRDRETHVIVDGLFDMGTDLRNSQVGILMRVRWARAIIERRAAD